MVGITGLETSSGRSISYLCATFGPVALLLILCSCDREPPRTAPVELVNHAMTRQASHEKSSTEEVRSRNRVHVSHQGVQTCIELRNKVIDVFSLYCYERGRDGWKLVSERVETQ